jgi:hypothetical protein
MVYCARLVMVGVHLADDFDGAVEHGPAKAQLHAHQEHGETDTGQSQSQSAAVVCQVQPG